jgi:Tol biopolymer transport system component
VTASSHGDLAVTHGELFPWARTAVTHRAPEGQTLHTWDFTRGMAEAPRWSPDGSRLIASYSEAPDALPAIVTLAATGTQRTIGHGTAPAAGADGTIYAGHHERIVRFSADGAESTVVERRGAWLDRPLPSPDGSRLVYRAARDNRTEIRLVSRDGRGDRLVVAWDRDRIQYCWSADGTRLYAIVGGTWDWQLWDIPIDSGSITTLASGAAAIAALALSPDGTQVAFTAAPELDYPSNRRRLYVLRVSDRTVRSIDVPGVDLSQLTWTGTDSLVVVAAPATAGDRWMLPATRVLKRVRVSDGSAEDLS